MRTAVASSSHHCAEILHAASLTALFDARVDGVDLDRLSLAGKPDFQRALRSLRMRRLASKRLAPAVSASSSALGPPRAPDLLKHGANEVVANLGEVRLEGTAHLP